MAQQVASAPSPRFEGPAGGEPPLRRSHRRDIYGALDLGTNNCRLLIARPSDGGFTVLDASGQWRDPMGTIISEPSRNLVVIVRDPASGLPKITAIRDTYKTRFRQDAVLFVQSQICAGF